MNRWLILLLGLALIRPVLPKKEASLRLEFRKLGIGVCYDYEPFLQRYQELEAKANASPVLELCESDIESVRSDPQPTSRWIFQLTASAKERFESVALNRQQADVFTLSLNGKILFQGMMYEEIGAAAVGFPVMHYNSRRYPGQLRLGACQGAFFGTRPEPTARQRISPPELVEFLSSRGNILPIDLPAGQRS